MIDTFTYTIVDSRGATATATVTVTVTGINDPPSVLNDDFTVNQDTPSTLDVLANDSDPEGPLVPATLQVVAGFGPTKGIATVVNGAIRYTPTPSVTGSDSFRYQVADANGVFSTATVTLTIRQTPSAWQNPLRQLDVNADSFVTPIDALLIINLLNTAGSGALAGRTPPIPTQPYVDTSGDSALTSLDALLVINAINAGAGEGESLLVNVDPTVGSEFIAAPTIDATSSSAVLVDHRWSPADAVRSGALTGTGRAIVTLADAAFADASVLDDALTSAPEVDRGPVSGSGYGGSENGDSGDSGDSGSSDVWGEALDAILTDGI